MVNAVVVLKSGRAQAFVLTLTRDTLLSCAKMLSTGGKTLGDPVLTLRLRFLGVGKKAVQDAAVWENNHEFHRTLKYQKSFHSGGGGFSPPKQNGITLKQVLEAIKRMNMCKIPYPVWKSAAQRSLVKKAWTSREGSSPTDFCTHSDKSPCHLSDKTAR